MKQGQDPERSRLAKFIGKRSVRWALWSLSFITILYLLRYPLLRGIGNFLIVEDPVVHVDAIYVLGGAAIDRGEEAARLYKHGVSDRIVCTGESVPGDLQALDINVTESECAEQVVEKNGVPADHVEALKRGTSTLEESIALIARAKQDGMDSVMIVSNSFHLRRIAFVFRPRFKAAHITLLLHGAPSHQFNTDNWWEKEEGLMMVNNEYVKLVYYHLKY